MYVLLSNGYTENHRIQVPTLVRKTLGVASDVKGMQEFDLCHLSILRAFESHLLSELFKSTENPKHASNLYTPTVLVNFKCLNLKI